MLQDTGRQELELPTPALDPVKCEEKGARNKMLYHHCPIQMDLEYEQEHKEKNTEKKSIRKYLNAYRNMRFAMEWNRASLNQYEQQEKGR